MYINGANTSLLKLDCKDQLEPVKNQTEEGTEFGKNFDLPAIEEPNDYPSHKNSMNDLSHLDDGELNLMGSREMLAITKKAIESSNVKPRQASIDDSVIDNSTRVKYFFEKMKYMYINLFIKYL